MEKEREKGRASVCVRERTLSKCYWRDYTQGKIKWQTQGILGFSKQELIGPICLV